LLIVVLLTSQGRAKRLTSKIPPALGHQQFEKLLEGMTPLQPEQLLDVFGPKGVRPFLEPPFRRIVFQEKRRQATSQKTATQILTAEIRKV